MDFYIKNKASDRCIKILHEDFKEANIVRQNYITIN